MRPLSFWVRIPRRFWVSVYYGSTWRVLRSSASIIYYRNACWIGSFFAVIRAVYFQSATTSSAWLQNFKVATKLQLLAFATIKDQSFLLRIDFLANRCVSVWSRRFSFDVLGWGGSYSQIFVLCKICPRCLYPHCSAFGKTDLIATLVFRSQLFTKKRYQGAISVRLREFFRHVCETADCTSKWDKRWVPLV